VARTTAYLERQRNETFALQWAGIDEEVTESLEPTALALASRRGPADRVPAQGPEA
jgi:hypothetical protein